jgi:hypothetical protein
MAYDQSLQRTVLYGGKNSGPETWEWDGETWNQSAALPMSTRRYHAMAYDSARQKTVLFGGIVGNEIVVGDSWERFGQTWSQVDDGSPSPRFT